MKSVIKIFLSLFLIIGTVAYAADTASILPPAKTTFLDSNGKPLTTGTVDFYIPNTTTRKATWKDAAETILNTNPVVLDAAGRALILGSGSYRQVVKDKLNNVIWDQVTSSAGSGSASNATGDGDLVGTIKPWAGMTAPNQYMFTYGQEVSRTTFSALFTAMTSVQSTFCTSGSAVLSGLSDTTNLGIGSHLEISCVVSGQTSIISKTSSTVTMADNSNVTTNSTARFFPWTNGDGATTFNLPDFRGRAVIGNNIMGGVAGVNLTTTYYSGDPNGVGVDGGNQGKVLISANLPPYTPAGTITNGAITNTVTGGTAGAINTATAVAAAGHAFADVGSPIAVASAQATSTFAGTAAAGQISTPISVVQPSTTANFIIKVTPDANSSTASGVTSLGGMTGDIACGSSLTCTGNIINGISSPTGTNGYHLTSNGPSVAASYQGYLAYSGTTQRTWQSKAGDSVNIMDYAAQYNCIPGDYTTDCTAAFNAAIQAVYNYSQSNGGSKTLSVSGTVHVPASAGCFRILSAITMLQGISLEGEGGLGSCILANDTDALHYAFIAYYGQPQVSNIFFYGCKWNAGTSTCDPATAARTAIKRVSATVSPDVNTDLMYGLAIQNVLMYNFDTAIDVVSVRFFWINNSFFQNINTCVNFRGFGFSLRTNGLSCTRASGDGLGVAGDGLSFLPFTYAVGGTLGPEGIEISQTSLGGFNNTVNFNKVVFATIDNSDIQAYVNGIKFKDATGGLFIKNTYIEVDGTAAHAGIFGEGSGGAGASGIINIDSNYLIATGSVNANGIQINEAGLFGQHNVNITNNLTDGFTGRDIYAFGPSQITVDGNVALSTVPTNSIEFTSIIVGPNFITRNRVARAIVANAGDITSGNVRKCDNAILGASEACTWNITTNSTTANRLMLGGGSGVQPTAFTAGTANQLLHGGTPPTWSAVANADLTNSATTVNGQTCTLGSTCTVVAAATSIAVGTTTITSGTTNGLLYNNGGLLGNLASAASGVLVTSAGSVPSISSTLPSGLTIPSPTFTGTVAGAGTIPNSVLVNSSTTINGTSIALGASGTVTAAAGTLTGTTLNATVVTSSLTSLGTITSLNATAIGAGTPGTGAFTTLTASTSVSSPIHASPGAHTFQSNGSTYAGQITTGQQWVMGANAAPVTGPTLTINQNTGTPSVATSGTINLHMVGADSATPSATIDTYAGQSSFEARYAGGTQASKTSAGANTSVFSFVARGYETSAAAYGVFAIIDLNTGANAFTSSDHNGYVRFRTVASGSTSALERLRVQQGLSIASTADPGVGAMLLNPQVFSALTACSSTIKGSHAYVTDSTTVVWGATITGSGANNVEASCNGTNWTVAAK